LIAKYIISTDTGTTRTGGNRPCFGNWLRIYTVREQAGTGLLKEAGMARMMLRIPLGVCH
jgi:hypothetical protein